MKAILVDAHTGARKHVQIGFSWPVFLLLLVVLLPVALAVGLALISTFELPRALAVVPFVAAGVFSQGVARRANALRIRRLLDRGWTLVDPDSPEAGRARAAAGLPSHSPSRAESSAAAHRPSFGLDDAALAAARGEIPSAQPPIYRPMEGAMKVLMINPRTGELKSIKIGWSWTIFLFSSFFAIPLFMRRLYGWASFSLLWPIASAIILNGLRFPSEGAEMAAVTANWIIQIALLVYLALNGNAFTARALVKRGWTFAHPGTVEAQYARKKWQLASNAPLAPSMPQI